MNPPNSELIIESPENQSRVQKITTWCLTLVCWAGWFCLWVPLFIGNFGLDEDNNLNLVISSAVGIVVLSVSLVVWARINRMRFQGKTRRGSAASTTVSDRADFFSLDERKILQAKRRKIVTVHFDERIMLVSLSDQFVKDLKAEASPYIVSDIVQPGLRVRVRPSGEKRFVFYADDRSTITMGDPTELSIYDARRIAAKLQNASTGSVKSYRQYASGTTLEQFLRRHYKPSQRGGADAQQYVETVVAQLGPLGGRPLLSVTSADVLEYQDQMLISNLVEGVILQRMELLRAIFGRAVKWGAIPESPMKGVDIYRIRADLAA